MSWDSGKVLVALNCSRSTNKLSQSIGRNEPTHTYRRSNPLMAPRILSFKALRIVLEVFYNQENRSPASDESRVFLILPAPVIPREPA